MKFTSVLLGALATATMVSAIKPSAAPSSKYDDDCDDYPKSKVHHSSKKVAPVPVSSTPCSDDYPKSTYCPSSKAAVPVKHSSYKPHRPYPVHTKTVIVVVPTFTKKCHGPTTIIKFDQTIIVDIDITTIVTFSKGPYTRTKTELECATTTTEYFDIDECPTGWPYAIDQEYVPIPVTYTPCSECTPVAAAAVPVVLSPATAIAGVPAVSAPGVKAPVVFTSGASHAQAGVVALIAGVVAAMMVL
jgi:hypothetical protein